MINFNGYDLSNDIRVTDVKRPVLPPSLLTTETIVGRSGSFVYYKQHGAYEIPVSFMIIEKDQHVLRQKVRELASKLDTNEPATLIFDDEPDKYIKAIVSDSTELDEKLAIGSGTINFFCPDPYWYAIHDDVIEKTGSGLHKFIRQGTAESYPFIEIKGQCNNGTILIENESTTMKFTGVLAADETLYLDSDLITAYIEDYGGRRRSVINNLDTLDFPVLKSGPNSLTIEGSQGATVSSVKITCRSRWK